MHRYGLDGRSELLGRLALSRVRGPRVCQPRGTKAGASTWEGRVAETSPLALSIECVVEIDGLTGPGQNAPLVCRGSVSQSGRSGL